MGKWIWTAVLCLTLAAVGTASAQAAALSSDVNVLVEFASVDKLDRDSAAFLAAVGIPVTGQRSESLLTGTPLRLINAAAMDLGKPVRIIVLDAARFKSPVYTCGLAQTQGFLMVGESTKIVPAGDLMLVEQTQQEFDMNAFNAAPMEQRKDAMNFMKKTTVTFAVGQANGMAYVSADQAAVKAAMALALPSEATLKPGACVALVARPQAALAEMKASGSDPISRMQSLMGKLPGGISPAEQNEAAMMLQVLEALVDQMELVTCSVTVGAQGIDADANFTLKADGTVAAYLKSIPAGPLQTLKYLPADDIGAVYCRMGDLGALVNWYATALAPAAAGDAAKAEAGTFIVKMKRAAELYGKEFAMAGRLLPSGGVCMYQAIQVRNPADIEQAMSEAMSIWNGSVNAPGSGLHVNQTFEPKALKVGEKEVSKYTMTIDFSSIPLQAIPQEQREQVTGIQEKVFAGAFGNPMEAYATTFDDYLVTTIGKDSLAEMRGIIGALPAPNASTQMTGIPENAMVGGVLSLSRLMRFAMAMMSSVEPAMGATSAMANIQPGPGITVWAVTAPNGLTANLHVPSAEVRGPVEAVMGMLGGLMMAPGEMEMTPAAPGAAPAGPGQPGAPASSAAPAPTTPNTAAPATGGPRQGQGRRSRQGGGGQQQN